LRAARFGVRRFGFDFMFEFLSTAAYDNGGERIVRVVTSAACAKGLLRALRCELHYYEHFIGPVEAQWPIARAPAVLLPIDERERAEIEFD